MDVAAVTAVISGINAFGIFGILYKVGRYTGRTDKTIESMEKNITAMLLYSERIARLEANLTTAGSDIQLLRASLHDLRGGINETIVENVTRYLQIMKMGRHED